jgi:RNA polymerase sigma-70 factor (ECF subfamily)
MKKMACGGIISMSRRPQDQRMTPLAPETLGRLYRQHAAALRLYARQWGGLAEDVVQEAFVKLAQTVPPPDRVLPWLYRVVRNEALAASRSDVRRRRRESLAGSHEAWFSRADDKLDAEQATLVLAELPLDQREVIVARLWGGLTFDDIAQLAGCSLATAHRRYQTGLATLQERLESPCKKTTTNPATP